jgi:hypothetical protein
MPHQLPSVQSPKIVIPRSRTSFILESCPRDIYARTRKHLLMLTHHSTSPVPLHQNLQAHANRQDVLDSAGQY